MLTKTVGCKDDPSLPAHVRVHTPPVYIMAHNVRWNIRMDIKGTKYRNVRMTLIYMRK
jgi:hypothetical protein